MTDQTQASRDSREKVEEHLRAVAQEIGGDALGAAAAAMLPMVLMRLPEDPALIDELLVQYAALLLGLRSDDAQPVHIALGPWPAAEAPELAE